MEHPVQRGWRPGRVDQVWRSVVWCVFTCLPGSIVRCNRSALSHKHTSADAHSHAGERTECAASEQGASKLLCSYPSVLEGTFFRQHLGVKCRTHGYGDVYSSPGLDLRQKQLLSSAFLVRAIVQLFAARAIQ